MAPPPQLRKRNPSLSFAPVWSDHWWGWGGGEGGTEELGSGWAAEGASRCDGGALAQADTPAFESHLCPNCHVAAQLTSCWAIPEAWSLALGSCGIGVGWADFSVLGGDLEGLILSLE